MEVGEEFPVRCGKIVHYRAKTNESKVHPTILGYLNVNVTSGGGKWKGLSPMKLGPLTLYEPLVTGRPEYPDGLLPGGTLDPDSGTQFFVSQNLENAWQYSKVLDVDVDPIENELHSSFFTRRAKGFADPTPHRRVLKADVIESVRGPRDLRYATVAAYWGGDPDAPNEIHRTAGLFDYVTSRYFYCLYYSSLVYSTPEFQELQALLAAGEKLHIIGYDGYDLLPTPENLLRAYNDPTRPFGHELVIVSLLTGYYPWEQIRE